jgi:hypothetical protein
MSKLESLPKRHRGPSVATGYLVPTTYSDVEVTLTPGPVKVFTNAWTAITVRELGTITTTVSRDRFAPTRHTYTLLEHVTTGHSDPSESIYKRDILIGSWVDDDHEHQVFAENASSRGNLWCGNCFHDDIYGNKTGGVQVPNWMVARYFSQLHNIPCCQFCDARFYTTEELNRGVLDTRTLAPPIPPRITAPLFSAIESPPLYRYVNSILAPLGLGTTECQHATSGPMQELSCRQELVSKAMSSERVASILDKHGFEGLEASF